MTRGLKRVSILLAGFGLVATSAAQNVLETAGLRVELDGRGAITKLIDPRTGSSNRRVSGGGKKYGLSPSREG